MELQQRHSFHLLPGYGPPPRSPSNPPPLLKWILVHFYVCWGCNVLYAAMQLKLLFQIFCGGYFGGDVILMF